jgi:protein gp37
VGDRSAIEWTDATWNPTTGCDRVSPGCDHCYALTLAKRLKAMDNPRYQNDGRPSSSGPGFGLTLHSDKLADPLSWRDPRFVFVNSMSDLFHAGVPKTFIRRAFATMQNAQRHTFQILTKRPARMAKVLRDVQPDPLPNVWLGTSVEDQHHADKRVDLLLETPAAVRFLSCEPLLGPIDLRRWVGRLEWVIVGGESGHHARPMDPSWVRAIRDQCVVAGVPFFMKQWGGRTPKAGGREIDGRTWDAMPSLSRPAPLRRRETGS